MNMIPMSPPSPPSPGVVSGSLRRHPVRSAMDIGDAGLGLIRHADTRIEVRSPCVALSASWDPSGIFAEVACIDKILQSLRRLLLVGRVLVDDFAEAVKVHLQRALAASEDQGLVDRESRCRPEPR